MENVINFTVNKISAAHKAGHVVVNVTFKSNEKSYTYVRKAWGSDKEKKCIIDGCTISYNPSTFEVNSITRIYKTEKGDGSGIQKSVSEKIKKAVEELKASETEVKELPSVEKAVKAEKKFVEGPVFHKAYNDIKKCLECGIPAYLAGPAGAGKNYTVEQIAKELGWNFYFSNSVQQEYKLTGFIDAGGKFHETEFYKACMDGNDCVFFLDEMDASIPDVLVLLNAAIANGYFEFPNGKLTLDHVHFVAAGNTVGSGADDVYTGRMVLDQATLDRFAIIEFDYDENVELNIAKGNEELVAFVHEMRKQAEEKGIRATFSLRCLTMVTKLEKAGMQLSKIIKIAVVKGLDKDTVNTFSVYGFTENKYFEALREVQQAA